MTPFEYVARTQSGRTVCGRIAAETPDRATEAIRSRGLVPLAVAPMGGAPVVSHPPEPSAQHPSASHTSTLADWAARSVDHALQGGEDDSWRVHLIGPDLLERLQDRPEAFPDWVAPTVVSLQKHGTLEAALGEIEWALEADEETARAIQAPFAFARTIATLAPVIISSTVHAVRRLSASADKLLSLYGPAVLTCGLVHLAFRYLWHSRSARAARARMYLNLPWVGPWLRLYGAQRFAHILRALLDQGVPLAEAVTSAAPSVGMPAMARRLRAAAERPEHPCSPYRLFAEAGVLPPEVVAQVAVLEEVGGLDDLGRQLVEDVDRRTAEAFTGMRFAAGMACAGVVALVLLAAGSAGALISRSEWLQRVYMLTDD